MNHCTLMAEIVEAPQLRYTSDNQTPIAEFTVSVPGLRPEDSPSQFRAIGWGNLAQTIQSDGYASGDRVILEGRLTMKTIDRPEGFREKQAEITIQRLYRITDLQSMSMPPSAPIAASQSQPAAPSSPPGPAKPATAAPTQTPDYDDIPF